MSTYFLLYVAMVTVVSLLTRHGPRCLTSCVMKSEDKAVPTELRTDGVKWRSLVKR